MRYAHSVVLFLLLKLCLSVSGQAQAPVPGALKGAAADQVRVLNAGWKFQTGDDPQRALPSFDDSAWKAYTIGERDATTTAAQALRAKPLPGWQAHGFPAYTGYAWYRMQVQLPDEASALSLLMPQHVNDNYEVYVEGQKIGGLGNLGPHPSPYFERPKLISIPPQILQGKHSATIAIRFWNASSEASSSAHNLNGGLRGPPLLGPSPVMQIFYQSLVYRAWKLAWPQWVEVGLFYIVGLISLFLFSLSTAEREYLWAGLNLTCLATVFTLRGISSVHDLSAHTYFLVYSPVVLLGVYALPLALMHLLSVPRPVWHRLNYPLTATFSTGLLLAVAMELDWLPATEAANTAESALYVLSLSLMACLLAAIAVDGLRTIGKRARAPLAPGFLFACALLTQIGVSFHKISSVVPLLFFCGFPVAILIVFLLRFATQQRENARLLEEMQQAQAVQHVMLPEPHDCIPGFTVETEYRPAREVGGDFFQVVPHPSGDHFLVVVGDVTGKGLQAGMLVALIVGTIRTEAAHTGDPAQILAALNTRLHARDHAHATCLALRIEASGAVTLANAGHLPPYLNGDELTMDGALPLGTLAEADFSILQFRLSPNDRLTLMSDGIAEAQDKSGTLFGFDRIATMLRSTAPVGTLAAAAQHHGQQDDMLVLQIKRWAV